MNNQAQSNAIQKMRERTTEESREGLSKTLLEVEEAVKHPIDAADLERMQKNYDILTTGLRIQVAIACEELDYPTRAREWQDSQPLELLCELYPGIEVSDWYQRMLMTILFDPTEEVLQIPSIPTLRKIYPDL